MIATFIESAARGVGNVRIGGRPMPGQGRLVDGLGRLARRFNGNSAVGFSWPGVRFETDLSDRIQRQMWAGIYEQHVHACLHALIDPGDVYVDVGAHIGYHATGAAHRVGSDGGVFAFEADPGMFERLNRNLNQFSWARATHAAVWDHTGTLSFSRSPVAQESGWGTLSDVRDFQDGEHLEVPALSLDEWWHHAHANRWDMMKLDAEGSEFAILQGARNVIDRFQPHIVMEINGPLLKDAGISPIQLTDFLKTRNYRLLAISFGCLEPWVMEKHGNFCEILSLPEQKASMSLDRLRRAGFELNG